ncbi:hypothetical protein [Basilea psittacipulmonis]|uniref:hypothetical protein n=1 Tax=Basilea psittacipulmonis TaxID=1472345 RepID=UPI001300EE93|nr:hypothetical protein [Basilea psittacipulmonis]
MTLLVACQTSYPRLFDENQTIVKQYQAQNLNTHLSSLIIVQSYQGTFRATQLTPLGVPITRQILTSSGWQNDGFLYPNRKASYLFSAIVSWQFPDRIPAPYTSLLNTGKWRLEKQENSAMIFIDKDKWLIQFIE